MIKARKQMNREELNRWSELLGVTPDRFESDSELRRRLQSVFYTPSKGTIAELDVAVAHTIDRLIPAHVSMSLAKKELAFYWITRDKPDSFWARPWYLLKAFYRLWKAFTQ